jgi:ketosteroid isomerase-like protein
VQRMPHSEPGVAELVARVVAATNAHDVDGIVSCFAPDYVNETPVHPLRGFRGREQVRLNWERILPAVPDLRVEVTASVVDGNTAWTEWEHRGTRLDGTPHLMRGVMIFAAAGGFFTRMRFYLETVEQSTGDVNAAVYRIVHAGSGSHWKGES